MALVMVQGHVFDTLLRVDIRALEGYQFQATFHGTTAPGFLFASGFVAGLPRAPLSARASLRRARRLLFVLGVGYALHLPYWSLWKTLSQATPAQKAALYACDALQVIALTQLFVLGLQWLTGRHWILAAGVAGLAVLAAGPFVWASGLSARVEPALAACLDVMRGSHFPVFPFSAFVLAGAVAGAAIGRQDPPVRRRRAARWGVLLVAAGLALALPLAGRVAFWGVSPAYALVRMGGLLLLLRLVESWARRDLPGTRPLALLGHETLLVYVLHLLLLYGGVVATGPLARYAGRLDLVETSLALLALLPVLLLAAWSWHALKARAPHHASALLALVSLGFVFEFLTRPW
jgi:hypothetical protein